MKVIGMWGTIPEDYKDDGEIPPSEREGVSCLESKLWRYAECQAGVSEQGEKRGTGRSVQRPCGGRSKLDTSVLLSAVASSVTWTLWLFSVISRVMVQDEKCYPAQVSGRLKRWAVAPTWVFSLKWPGQWCLSILSKYCFIAGNGCRMMPLTGLYMETYRWHSQKFHFDSCSLLMTIYQPDSQGFWLSSCYPHSTILNF